MLHYHPEVLNGIQSAGVLRKVPRQHSFVKAVIDRICAEVDRAFTEIEGLAERYPDAPAAKGRATSELKMFVEDRKGHDRRYAIDETKARNELGYAPQHDFENGLRNTLRWYLENEGWWRPLLAPTQRDGQHPARGRHPPDL